MYLKDELLPFARIQQFFWVHLSGSSSGLSSFSWILQSYKKLPTPGASFCLLDKRTFHLIFIYDE
uniref:Uncharacterized protein n=1 Tax=Aegilops tauschii subsp. strangulata TaxID=200361 RepID=A0A453HDB3_AEGTS